MELVFAKPTECPSSAASLLSMSARHRGTALEIAKRLDFAGPRRRSFPQSFGETHSPAGGFCDLLPSNSGMQLRHSQLFGNRIRFHNTKIGDHRDSPFARQTQAFASLPSVKIAH